MPAQELYLEVTSIKFSVHRLANNHEPIFTDEKERLLCIHLPNQKLMIETIEDLLKIS